MRNEAFAFPPERALNRGEAFGRGINAKPSPFFTTEPLAQLPQPLKKS
jgi:hypothetical protein